MPQVFNVLNCCGCGTFQVHQVVKAKKWTCKMCAVKQSFVKVFSEGTGAECRQHVQKLNMLRAQNSSLDVAMAAWEQQVEQPEEQEHHELISHTADKWSKYVDEDEPETDDDLPGEDLQSTTDFRTFQNRKRNATRVTKGGSVRKYGRNEWYGADVVSHHGPTSCNPSYLQKPVEQKLIGTEVVSEYSEINGSFRTEKNDLEQFLLCANDFDEPFDVEGAQNNEVSDIPSFRSVDVLETRSDTVQSKLTCHRAVKDVLDNNTDTKAGSSKWAKYIDEADEYDQDSEDEPYPEFNAN